MEETMSESKPIAGVERTAKAIARAVESGCMQPKTFEDIIDRESGLRELAEQAERVILNLSADEFAGEPVWLDTLRTALARVYKPQP